MKCVTAALAAIVLCCTAASARATEAPACRAGHESALADGRGTLRPGATLCIRLRASGRQVQAQAEAVVSGVDIAGVGGGALGAGRQHDALAAEPAGRDAPLSRPAATRLARDGLSGALDHHLADLHHRLQVGVVRDVGLDLPRVRAEGGLERVDRVQKKWHIAT